MVVEDRKLTADYTDGTDGEKIGMGQAPDGTEFFGRSPRSLSFMRSVECKSADFGRFFQDVMVGVDMAMRWQVHRSVVVR